MEGHRAVCATPVVWALVELQKTLGLAVAMIQVSTVTARPATSIAMGLPSVPALTILAAAVETIPAEVATVTATLATAAASLVIAAATLAIVAATLATAAAILATVAAAVVALLGTAGATLPGLVVNTQSLPPMELRSAPWRTF